jgi:hypothetical protein
METITYTIWPTNSYSDEVETCEHCGKTGLKRTRVVNLQDNDGMIHDKLYFGTTCAMKLAAGKTDGTRYAELGENL